MDNILKIVWLLLGAPILFLLYKPLVRSVRWRRGFIVGHTLLLACLTLFVFNQPSWRWADQTGLSQQMNKMHDHPEAYRYIDDHFILIDNALNHQLVPALRQYRGNRQ